MAGKKNEDRQLIDVVECRFLNADGAGLVVERLPQHELLRLYRWFAHQDGGKSGGLLLEIAPILDTLVEVGATLPPFITRSVTDAEAATDETGEAKDGDDSEGNADLANMDIEELTEEFRMKFIAEEASSPTEIPDGVQPGMSGSSPRMLAYGFFGCGLMWGADYLESVVDSDSTPFPVRGEIADFLECVSDEDVDFLSGDKSLEGENRMMSPAWLTREIVRRVPALEVVLRSAYRLSRRCRPDEWESDEDGAHYRFLFFLGLFATGLRIPALSQKNGFAR